MTEENTTPVPALPAPDPAPAPVKPAKPAPAELDPFELHWLGDGTLVLPGVPADDLTPAQVDRLVYVATVGTLQSPDHDEGVMLVRGLQVGDDGWEKARGDLVASLRGSGLYGDAGGK